MLGLAVVYVAGPVLFGSWDMDHCSRRRVRSGAFAALLGRKGDGPRALETFPSHIHVMPIPDRP